MRLLSRRALFALSFVVIAAMQFTGLTSAFADHEPNHRYVIKGTVTDRSGKPWAGKTVTVTHRSQPAVKVPTNRKGEYSTQLHLHDSDVGSEITLDVEGAQPVVHVVDFDANDVKSTRAGTANVVTDKDAPELSLAQRSPIPVWLIALVGLIAGVIVGSKARSRRRNAAESALRKAEKAKAGKKKSSGKGSKGKKKK